MIGLLNIILLCYFGEIATESYERMADCWFEANWLSLTIKQRKNFIVIIACAQTPLRYNGSGLAVLNLETLRKVSRISACEWIHV